MTSYKTPLRVHSAKKNNMFMRLAYGLWVYVINPVSSEETRIDVVSMLKNLFLSFRRASCQLGPTCNLVSDIWGTMGPNLFGIQNKFPLSQVLHV